MPNAWERLENESAKAFEAFTAYRDIGPDRSARAVWEKCGKSRGLIERWCAQYRWKDRAEAYDDYRDREARKTAVSDYKKMNARHAKIGMQLQNTALLALKKLGEQLEAGELTPNQILSLVPNAAKGIDIERAAKKEEVGLSDGGIAQDAEDWKTAIIAAAARREAERGQADEGLGESP